MEDSEKRKAKYKCMCKSVETYANKKPILLTDIRRLSKDLERAKLYHQAYAKKIDCKVSKLKEERQLAKVEQILALRILIA